MMDSLLKKLKTAGVFITVVIVIANPIASLITYLIIEDKFKNKGDP